MAVLDVLRLRDFSKRTGLAVSITAPIPRSDASLSPFRGPMAKQGPRSTNTVGLISPLFSGSSNLSALASRKGLQISRTRTNLLNSLSDLCSSSSKYSPNWRERNSGSRVKVWACRLFLGGMSNSRASMLANMFLVSCTNRSGPK